MIVPWLWVKPWRGLMLQVKWILNKKSWLYPEYELDPHTDSCYKTHKRKIINSWLYPEYESNPEDDSCYESNEYEINEFMIVPWTWVTPWQWLMLQGKWKWNKKSLWLYPESESDPDDDWCYKLNEC